MEGVLALLLAYLWGGIPSAYLLVRFRRGVDLRKYGSGNVGASNVTVQLGTWYGLGLGTFDCLVKGTLPVVAAKAVGLSPALQAGVGMAAIAGHNWSPYLRFTGGRGVATAVGTLVAFLAWRELLIFGAIGGLIGRVLLKDTGLWIGLGMALVPLWAFLFGQPTTLVYYSLALVGLLALKRLTSNWRRPPSGYPLFRVLWCRLAFDRDVPRRADWVSRTPSEEPGQSGGT